MKKNCVDLSANDILLCEVDFEMKALRIVMCDLIILINDCIKYNIDYDIFKSSYLDYQDILNDFKKLRKDLEVDKNV